jgi:hypothetical protein
VRGIAGKAPLGLERAREIRHQAVDRGPDRDEFLGQRGAGKRPQVGGTAPGQFVRERLHRPKAPTREPEDAENPQRQRHEHRQRQRGEAAGERGAPLGERFGDLENIGARDRRPSVDPVRAGVAEALARGLREGRGIGVVRGEENDAGGVANHIGQRLGVRRDGNHAARLGGGLRVDELDHGQRQQSFGGFLQRRVEDGVEFRPDRQCRACKAKKPQRRDSGGKSQRQVAAQAAAAFAHGRPSR